MAKVPEVSMAVWKELYAAAAEFGKMKPWERFEDSEVFGIHDLVTGQMGYACILGALGEMLALCVYRGAGGFDVHRRMQMREFDIESGDIAGVQDCLIAEFADREDLEKEDLRMIGRLDLKFRGRQAWPLFRSHVPGYAAWHLTELEAKFLAVAFGSASAVIRKVDAENLDLTERPGQVFCCFPGEGPSFETRWEPAPTFEPAPAQPPVLDAEKLSRIKTRTLQPGGIWEADAPYFPAPLMDNDRPYFPRTTLVVHRDSGYILNGGMVGPEKSKPQAMADAILESIEKSGRLPQAVHVRGKETARLLSALGDGLGVQIEPKTRLDMVLEAKDELVDAMTRGSGEPPEKTWDRRSMEKTTYNLSKKLGDRDFASKEEADEYLRELEESGELDEAPAPNSAVEAAQNLMYEAFELASPVLRVKLARRALKISPDCADAYNLLAEETTGSLEQERELYQKAVEAGERALGRDFFSKNAGHFWGAVDSRPYMRARAELARCLWEIGDREAALGHWQELLRLNPNDNQGMRHVLLARLGELGRFDDIREILSRYEKDCSAEVLLMRTLAIFQSEGPSPRALAELQGAWDRNKHFPDYFTGAKKFPRRHPERLEMGGESEAAYAVAEVLPAWKKVPGALEWISAAVQRLALPKVGRNDACPCGSGKKFKKCCAV